jgi:hypothetical protein
MSQPGAMLVPRLGNRTSLRAEGSPIRLLCLDEEGNMADERSRMEVAQVSADKFGPAVTAALMEGIPPYGWHEIATEHDLAALEGRIDLKLDARFHAAESRIIRWTVASVFGGIASISGAAAVVAALVS